MEALIQQMMQEMTKTTVVWSKNSWVTSLVKLVAQRQIRSQKQLVTRAKSSIIRYHESNNISLHQNNILFSG